MEKSVFIVECSAGLHDDWHWWIDGVYNNIEKAEKRKVKIEANVKEIQDKCPIQYHDDMTEDDEHKYYLYLAKHPNEMEWYGCKVNEYKLK